MKLFSRKALVAGAAAVALSFAGTSAAAADDQHTPTPFSSLSSSSDEDKTPEDDGLSSQDPKKISAWISVFTAVIGALGALYSFASKYLGFKL